MRLLEIGRAFRPEAAAVLPRSSLRERLADTLVARGLLTREAMVRAEALAHQTETELGQTLLEIGLVAEDVLFDLYHEFSGLPRWSEKGSPIQPPPLPVEFLYGSAVLPIHDKDQPCLVLGYCEDEGLVDLLRHRLPDHVLFIHGLNDTLYRLEQAYEITTDPDTDPTGPVAQDVDHLRDLALDSATVRYVNDMLQVGMKLGASDIHLEPERNRIQLRYRRDGVLQERPGPSTQEYPAIVSRIKIMADLDIAERRLPQDGRFRSRFGVSEIDVRVSTMPARHGEDIVLRLLRQRQHLGSLDEIGFDAVARASLRNMLRRSQGLLLVTGPTGVGKTTTLYAGLTELIDGRRKIITVEDPIEYELAGIAQIQANEEIGLIFPKILRSILRHDPDIVFIGEIRDRETAEIAVQAALTGHLVLSTLHTTSALGAPARLINMGVPDYLVASCLIGATAQRLARQVCSECGHSIPIDPAAARLLGLPEHQVVRQAVGCDACFGTGYAGRIPLIETAEIDDRLRVAIRDNPVETHLAKVAAGSTGYRSLLSYGGDLVAAGVTTVDEILRVAS